LELRIKQFVEMASKIGMAANAINNLVSLKDIWDNENLSTGEKVLQTITNVGSSLGMLLPLITSVTAAISKKAAANAADATTSAMAAATAKFEAEMVENCTDEIQEAAFWKKILTEVTDDLTEE
jgi:hypothetical protein